jgi:hypothetical protein
MAECARAFPPYYRRPGGQHALQGAQDDARSAEIAARGYRVIRFWNGELMENLTGVIETICPELTISLSALGRRGLFTETAGSWDAR